MAQTIKKLLNYYLTQYPITEYLELFKNIIFDDILKVHEKELAEKDKEHKEQLKRMYEQFKHDKELEIGQYKFETEKQKLFKEDFETKFIEYTSNLVKEKYILKNNSKYDLLKSKENK